MVRQDLEEEFTTQRKNLENYFATEVTSAESATQPTGPAIHARTSTHNNILHRHTMDPTVMAVLNTSPVS